MPEYKKISQLDPADSLLGSDQFEIERDGASKSVTGNDIKAFANSGLIDDIHSGSQATYSSQHIDQLLGAKQNSTDNSLATVSKNVVGAINEVRTLAFALPWVDVTGTLIAGNTSVTLSNAAITTASTIDVYADIFGVSPTDMVVSAGQVVLTFPAQSSNMNVKVRIT